MANVINEAGVPAICFDCKDGGLVGPNPKTLKVVAMKGGTNQLNVDFAFKMKCLCCNGDNVGFRHVTNKAGVPIG